MNMGKMTTDESRGEPPRGSDAMPAGGPAGAGPAGASPVAQPRFTVVVTDYNYESLDQEHAIIGAIGAELRDYHCRTEDEVLAVARDCDILVVQFAPITRRVIGQLTRCRLIVRYAIGVDNIDLAAATEYGIPVANVPDYGIDEVSTHAVCLILAAARKLPQTIRSVRAGQWNYALVKPLHRTRGARLGLVGLGRIPALVAHKMAGFGMEIVAHDPYVTESHAAALGVRLVSLVALAETCDYISIHCPLTAETRGLFNMDLFRRMKPGVFVVNTARGPVISQPDLIQALREGLIAGAALDVLESEPIEAGNPLLTMDNVMITPHMAWYTEESIRTLQARVAEEAVRVLRGERPLNLVNKDVYKGK